ncbi:cytochrome c oxidase assembly protein COX16-domain-containing protein [Thelephora terrestris]|uniref:Cytochrome c oxidase assembly protein COX16, mitochondrial n=1 Tax=Thelephora terrestris TaxID=56493 RepID=A0A9P6HP73_9AGAM|nr:cytochrome c oxidase assembly protein COX16-domain-containing protein [Thelephora terrestris]
MGVFDSRPLNSTPLNNRLRKSPLLFGVPFVMIMVVASYALVPFAQTKYELQDRRVLNVTKEQELGLENRKRKFDIREEYFASKLSAKAAEDWEPKRIERPAGTPEWGVPPHEPSRKKS